MADTFTCEHCGGTFDKGWSDEDATAEAREAFGMDIVLDPTMAVVCDECYKAMTAALPPKDWAKQH